MRHLAYGAAAVVAVLSLALSCSGTKKEDPPPPPPKALVFGRLVDPAGQPPNGKGQVSIGSTTVETNESGFFSLEATTGSSLNLTAKVVGYAPTVKSFTVPAQGSSFVQVTLLPWGATTQFQAATGGSVSSGGSTVTFPANSLNATGTVTAKIAHLDPTDPGERGAFPGGFMTTDGSLLESFGAIAIQVEDSTGQPVNLKPGQTAAAQVAVRGAPADQVPLWSFDETAGRWKQEGTLTGCQTGTCAAQLPHLSWWNADQVYETSCLRVCAKNSAGTPAVNVSLEARGVNYNGVSYGTTGADGCACLNVRKGSQVEIVGVTSGGVVGPVTETTGASVLTCSAGGCPGLTNPLTVETPKFQAILTWGAAPHDLDSHFTGPCDADAGSCSGRFHISYSNRGSLTAPPWAFLDTDDTSGFGPEITSLLRCMSGKYRFSVHRFSSDGTLEASGAKVHVILPNGDQLDRAVPASNDGGIVWVVGDLTCDAACACTWASVDTFGTDDTATYNP